MLECVSEGCGNGLSFGQWDRATKRWRKRRGGLVQIMEGGERERLGALGQTVMNRVMGVGEDMN